MSREITEESFLKDVAKQQEASHPNCNYAGWKGRLCSKCGNVHNQVPPVYLFGKPDTDAAPQPAGGE